MTGFESTAREPTRAEAGERPEADDASAAPTPTLPPQRIAQIAQNKLRSLGIPTFFNRKRELLGRLRIDPKAFDDIPGYRAEEWHSFVVQGHDHLTFVEPSPFRFAGPIHYFDLVSGPELDARVRQAWCALVLRTRAAVARARIYYPEAMLDTETWSLLVMVDGDDGSGKLRLIVRGERVGVQLLELDGTPWDASALGALGRWLEEDPVLHDASVTTELLQHARTLRDEANATHLDAGPVDLESYGYDAASGPGGPSIDISALPETPSTDLDALERLHIDASLGAPAVPNEGPEGSPVDADLGGLLLLNDAPMPIPHLASADLSPAAPDMDDLDALGLELPEAEPEPAATVARLPRLRTSAIDVSASWGNHGARARVIDLTLRGLFLCVDDDDLPPPGIEVVIGKGLGYSVAGRVAHVRDSAEGALLKTGRGFGVELREPISKDRAHGAPSASAPERFGSDCLLLMLERPEDVVPALATPLAANTRTILAADDAFDAVCFLHTFHVGRALLNDPFREASAASLVASLDLEGLGVRRQILGQAPASTVLPE